MLEFSGIAFVSTLAPARCIRHVSALMSSPPVGHHQLGYLVRGKFCCLPPAMGALAPTAIMPAKENATIVANKRRVGESCVKWLTVIAFGSFTAENESGIGE